MASDHGFEGVQWPGGRQRASGADRAWCWPVVRKMLTLSRCWVAAPRARLGDVAEPALVEVKAVRTRDDVRDCLGVRVLGSKNDGSPGLVPSRVSEKGGCRSLGSGRDDNGRAEPRVGFGGLGHAEPGRSCACGQ